VNEELRMQNYEKIAGDQGEGGKANEDGEVLIKKIESAEN